MSCECGAKPHTKEECIDSESRSDLGDVQSDATSDLDAPEPNTCCCSHGMRCTCALKKEYLDPVPEIDLPGAIPQRTQSARKPRLLKADSENSLTAFKNGHHKPVHKHNDSAHKCGLPYKIPIPHSIHGNADVARRSTDSLPLIRKKEETHSQLSESISSAQQEMRLVRSEHGSPEPRAAFFGKRDGQLPPLDLSYPPLSESAQGQFSEDYIQSPQAFDNYYTAQEEAPALSAGMPSVDWTSLGFNRAFSAAYSQPPSYASYDHNNVGQQGIATSSSGEVSEAGDSSSHNKPTSLYRPDLATTSAEERRSLNRLSSSSFTSMPQSSILSSSTPQKLDIDTYLHPATASPTEFEDPAAGIPLGSDAFVRHGFTVHDAQKLAHPETPTEAMGGLSLPFQADELDSLWSGSFDPRQAPFVSQNQVENDWSR